MKHEDPIWVRDKMMEIITERRKVYGEFKRYGIESVENQRYYEKENAKVTFSLRDEGVPIGILRDIAKGKMADIKSKLYLSEKMADNSKKLIEILSSDLTALQSIYKHLEIVNN